MYVKFAPLPADDVDRAIAFYVDRMGLTLATDAPYGDGGRWVELAMPEGMTSLLLEKGAPDRDRSRPALIFIVADLNAEHERLAAAEVEIVAPPAAAPWTPGVSYALIRDSEGNMVLLADG